MNKKNDLILAKGILGRLLDDYDTMFREDGRVSKLGYFEGMKKGMRTCPTRVKEELRLVRRLLLEVEKAL